MRGLTTEQVIQTISTIYISTIYYLQQCLDMEHKLCVGGRGGAGHRSLYPDNVSVSDPLTVAATRHHHQRYAAHCHCHRQQILLSHEDDVCFSAVSSVDIVIICINMFQLDL